MRAKGKTSRRMAMRIGGLPIVKRAGGEVESY